MKVENYLTHKITFRGEVMLAVHIESKDIVTFPGMEIGSVTSSFFNFTSESGLEHEDQMKFPKRETCWMKKFLK